MEKYLKVANYIGYEKTKASTSIVTIMELIKLCYISHGRELVKLNISLLDGDRIEA